jgi:hypothetical protein
MAKAQQDWGKETALIIVQFEKTAKTGCMRGIITGLNVNVSECCYTLKGLMDE